MKNAVASAVIGLVLIVLGALACRQGDPSIDPKTPPNSPIPTKVDRPDDPKSSPPPRIISDAGQ
jgi:hypothetical protein